MPDQSAPWWSAWRGWLGFGQAASEPYLTCIGPTAIWWIPKPRAPRIVVSTAVWAWLAALPVLGCTLYWCWVLGWPLWPFAHAVSSSPEILLRYESVLLVCLVYVTLRSLPTWWTCRFQARGDADRIEAAIREQRWDLAALLVHRYCLLTAAFRKRRPTQAARWDELIRPHLSRHRRLYLYFRGQPPELPPDPTASFAPVVTRLPQASLLLSGSVLILVGGSLYLLVLDIVRHRYWQGLVLFNTVLLLIILISYGGHFLLNLLGRSLYFRFAPGLIQVLTFRIGRHRPEIQTFDLRQAHAVLDLSSRWPGITLLQPGGAPSRTLLFPKQHDIVLAVLRAALSTATSPPLPQEGLVE